MLQNIIRPAKEDTSYWAGARCYELTNNFRTYGSASAGDRIKQKQCYGKFKISPNILVIYKHPVDTFAQHFTIQSYND